MDKAFIAELEHQSAHGIYYALWRRRYGGIIKKRKVPGNRKLASVF
jgi:hypothetical protein